VRWSPSYGAWTTFQVRVEHLQALTGPSFGALPAADPLHALETTGPAVHEVARPQDIML